MTPYPWPTGCWARFICGQKQYDQAIAQAERAIALDPNSEEAILAMGEILNYAGRPEKAIEGSEYEWNRKLG